MYMDPVVLFSLRYCLSGRFIVLAHLACNVRSAEPAKVYFTLLALHVVATLRFFNRRSTVWAPFVPFGVLFLKLIEIKCFLEFLKILARSVSVPGRATPETEGLRAGRTHRSLSSAFTSGSSDLRFAVNSWTPLFILVLCY